MFPITSGMLIAVAAGGAVGAVLRFLVQQFSMSYLGVTFPWGTLLVNVIGSTIIGVLSGYWVQAGIEVSAELKGALIFGCLGAFTTFSAFSIDTLVLYQDGEILKAMLNIAANVILCLMAVVIGSMLGIRLAS